MIILFALWNVYECVYDIITVNMNIFSFTFTSTAGFSLLMSNVVPFSRDTRLLGWEGEASADS